MKTEIHEVKTISGAAGGTSGNAIVNIQVIGKSDTVEQVRAMLSSAPELLEALQWALKNLEEIALPEFERQGRVTSINNAIEKARAAIAKAEGR